MRGRLLAAWLLAWGVPARPTRRPRGRRSAFAAKRSPLGAAAPLPGAGDCTWRTFNQSLDHFGGAIGTFGQRLCVVSPSDGALPQRVLFYTGNESPVEEYVNNTGLMWEYAAQTPGTLLVWAEHRYEGGSVPLLRGVHGCMSYCTVEQALADYAVIISFLKREVGDIPFVAVGGSYGGMLAAWLRMKYPGAVVGAIAASAPVWGFPLQSPPLDGAAVAITRGFSKAGGLDDDACADNMIAAWPLMSELGKTAQGRELLSEKFMLCDALRSPEEATELVEAVQSVFFDLAEANYPFPSTYITSAVGPGLYPLPAWPMRAACRGLAQPMATIVGDRANVRFTVHVGGVEIDVDWEETMATNYSAAELRASGAGALFDGVRGAWATWCNVTGELQCFDAHACGTGRRRLDVQSAPSSESPQEEGAPRGEDVCTAESYSGGSWTPLCCNDDLNLVNYLLHGVGRDFNWPPNAARGRTTLADVLGPLGSTGPGCGNDAGLSGYPATSDPWSQWLDSYFGRKVMDTSNIVFSNGLLDPWSAAGVFADAAALQPGEYAGPLAQNISAVNDVVALILPLGAHHLDLMFMDDDDPPDAVFARTFELEAIDRWCARGHEV